MSELHRRYQTRQAGFHAVADALAARAHRLSGARVLVFTAAVVLGVFAEERASALLWMLAGAALLAFLILVTHHRRVRRAEAWQRALSEANRIGILRRERAWSSLPSLDAPGVRGAADDLDIFGAPGLSQLFGPVVTPAAKATLVRWLVAPDPPSVLPPRQEAVRTLAAENDWRDALAAHALSARDAASEEEVAAFLDWAESPPWLRERPVLLWLTRVLPLLTLVLALAHGFGITERALWLLPLLAAAVIAWGGPGARVHAIFDRAFARQGVLQHYPSLLARAIAVPGDAVRLQELRASLSSGGASAQAALARLDRLMRLSETRYASMIHPVLQLLTLWDFHVLTRLEAWQSDAGGHARAWIEAAGEIEAIGALATLAHDQPDWCFPVVDAACDRVDARALGHPMLHDDVRVTNDVVVGPAGTVLLVTGSNMSGKSTLLRAVGANVLLAQAGAPVCATYLSMPPLLPQTSVRVSDSLTEGISLFLAELKRMQAIVEAARSKGERRLLYLLDEMLHGTNTAERRIAARTVIEHLLEHGAIGVVTTHDLALAEEPSIARHAIPVHFTEQVARDEHGVRMTFDFRLRPGLATSTNALTLLEIVGLKRQ